MPVKLAFKLLITVAKETMLRDARLNGFNY